MAVKDQQTLLLELELLFADNSVGDISAEDCRNFLLDLADTAEDRWGEDAAAARQAIEEYLADCGDGPEPELTVIVKDNFNGTAGTLIQDHTPDVDREGGGWIQVETNGDIQLTGAGAAGSSSSANTAGFAGGKIDAGQVNNYRITQDFVLNDNSYFNRWGTTFATSNPGANEGYTVRLEQGSGGAELVEGTANGTTIIDSFPYTASDGDLIRFVITYENETVTAEVYDRSTDPMTLLGTLTGPAPVEPSDQTLVAFVQRGSQGEEVLCEYFEVVDLNPQLPSVDIYTGLASWFDFNNNLTDSEGSLVLSQTQGTADYNGAGNAYVADNDRVEGTLLGDLAGSGAVSFMMTLDWNTLPGVAQVLGRLLQGATTSTLSWAMSLLDADTIRWAVYNTSGDAFVVDHDIVGLATGEIHQMIGTYDPVSGLSEMFIDGVSVGTVALSGTRKSADKFGFFNWDSVTVDRHLKANVHNAALYNSVITAEQAEALWNGGLPLEYSDLNPNSVPVPEFASSWRPETAAGQIQEWIPNPQNYGFRGQISYASGIEFRPGKFLAQSDGVNNLTNNSNNSLSGAPGDVYSVSAVVQINDDSLAFQEFCQFSNTGDSAFLFRLRAQGPNLAIRIGAFNSSLNRYPIQWVDPDPTPEGEPTQITMSLDFDNPGSGGTGNATAYIYKNGLLAGIEASVEPLNFGGTSGTSTIPTFLGRRSNFNVNASGAVGWVTEWGLDRLLTPEEVLAYYQNTFDIDPTPPDPDPDPSGGGCISPQDMREAAGPTIDLFYPTD